MAIDLVDNFLSYVLQHDVCPEYKNSVEAARAVCARAKQEFPAIGDAYSLLPGPFNEAAVRLYGQKEQQQRDGHDDSSDDGFAWYGSSGHFDANVGGGEAAAAHVFKTGLALAAGRDACEKFRVQGCTTSVARTYADKTFRVEALQRADEAMTALCARVRDHEGVPGNMLPLGALVLRTCAIDDGREATITEAEFDETQAKSVTVLVEDDVLALLRPGMKMEAKIVELDVGLAVLARVVRILPSFYTFLPQELMEKYKEPAPNPRPAPSVNDPAAEDAQFAAEDKA